MLVTALFSCSALGPIWPIWVSSLLDPVSNTTFPHPEFQTAGVTVPRAVFCAGRPDGPGHRHSRGQHPAGAQGPRRHQHRPGRGDVHLSHLRRGRIANSTAKQGKMELNISISAGLNLSSSSSFVLCCRTRMLFASPDVSWNSQKTSSKYPGT